MEYTAIDEAREATGLRLVLTAGVPGPWSEAAKGLFRVRNVDYIPVLQRGGGENEELVAWTGHRNAPTAMYNDEPPRVTALDLINLAQRLGKGPSLVPERIEDRVTMFGLLNELAGEGGFAWSARTLMFKGMIDTVGEAAMANSPMLRDYHYNAQEVATAPGKIIAVLDALAAQLAQQSGVANTADGGRYFCGGQLSALDIYWACFSQMVDPLPAEVNPMPQSLRDTWGLTAKALAAADYRIDPALLRHRDYIFPNYLQWPLDF